MLPSALRRVWLPWLLLIVPTLLVGGAALWLLHNDRQRLEAARTDTLSRASQAARAQTQLAADNIELLVAEIRDGLIRELAETPGEDLDPLLRNWPGTNPLVSQTFLWRSPTEELAWPDARTNEHRAFRQRHAALFNGIDPGLPRELSVPPQEFVRASELQKAKQEVAAARPLAAPPSPTGQSQNERQQAAIISAPLQGTVQAKEETEAQKNPVPESAAFTPAIDASSANTSNFSVNLNQELRRDAYNTNRTSAAEAKRAARGDNDLGLGELAGEADADKGESAKSTPYAEVQSRETDVARANRAANAGGAAPASAASSNSASKALARKTAPRPSSVRPSSKLATSSPAAAANRIPTDTSRSPAEKDTLQLPAPGTIGHLQPPQVVVTQPAPQLPKTDYPNLAAESARESETTRARVQFAKEQTLAAASPKPMETNPASATSLAEFAAGKNLADETHPLGAASPPAASAAPTVLARAEDSRAAAPKLIDDFAAQPAAEGRATDAADRRTALEEFSAARSSWIARRLNGQTYFLGWWQPQAGAPVRGVELNLSAVLERVQALVPNGLNGERYRLLGPAESARDADVVVPLASTLPGWTLAAWFAPVTDAESFDARGFFAVAVLLIVVFVGAVLAGGAIFFRQAASAEREAALKTNFVSNVSHEMKTPLTTIRMYAEMLADERVSDPEKRRRYFATIGRETTRLARLVNNALDFGRLEEGRKDYRAENIVLGPWLARLADTHAPRLAEAGVKLSVNPGEAALIARLDADSLEQMTLNLLDNAVKYAAAGGEIELRLETNSGRPTLIVADRGPGVPAAHRERIFERFHRVDETLTAKTQGAGLGLTIARRLARDQGGDLHYRDRAGGGSEFVLVLPDAKSVGASNDEHAA